MLHVSITHRRLEKVDLWEIRSLAMHALMIAGFIPRPSPSPVCIWSRMQIQGGRAVHVLRLISTADSRTERLHVHLPVSIRSSYITRINLIQPLLLAVGFPTKKVLPTNSSWPRLVVALKQTAKELVTTAFDWRNTVSLYILTYSFRSIKESFSITFPTRRSKRDSAINNHNYASLVL